MARIKKSPVGRRGFLKGAAAGAAVLVTKPELAKAQEAEAPAGGGRRAAAVPSEATVARENGNTARVQRPESSRIPAPTTRWTWARHSSAASTGSRMASPSCWT
jgi:secreted PhoX family phosphatase